MNAITSSTGSAPDLASAAAPAPRPPPPVDPVPAPAAPSVAGATTPGLTQLATALGMEPSAVAAALTAGTSLADLLANPSPPLSTVTDALAVVGLIVETSL